MKLMLICAGVKEKEPGIRSYQVHWYYFLMISIIDQPTAMFSKSDLNVPINPTCEVSQKTHFSNQNFSKLRLFKTFDHYLTLYFGFRPHSFFVFRNSGR